MRSNDRSIDVDKFMVNSPKGPAKSFMTNLEIIINFDGGAALDTLDLPTHLNILTIKIMIMLPGETSAIPYMGGMVCTLKGFVYFKTPV